MQIIGAPSFFPTVWGWIKRWFDPVTVSKIFILSHHDVKPTLEKYMHPDDFPKQYGGNLDWEWGHNPALGEAEKEATCRDGHREWIPGPCLWVDEKRVAVGSVHGKDRRANVPPEMVGRASLQLNGIPAAGRKSMAGSTRSGRDTAQSNEPRRTGSVASAAHAPAPNHASPAEQHVAHAEKNVKDSTVASEHMTNGFTTHPSPAPQPAASNHVPLHSSNLSAHTAVTARAAHLVPTETSVSTTSSGGIYLSRPAGSSEALAEELAAKTERLSMNGPARPPIEHFVTAAEGIPKAQVY